MPVNAFTNMMKMFPDADTLYLERFVDKEVDMVVGSPMRIDDGTIWLGMSVISSVQQAIASDYPIVVQQGQDALEARITELKGQDPITK